MKYPIIDMEKTGSYIKSICKKNGIRTMDIKNRLCMSSVQSVYDWFHGKTLPSVDNLLALSRMLGKSMDELLIVKDSGLYIYPKEYDGKKGKERVIIYGKNLMFS